MIENTKNETEGPINRESRAARVQVSTDMDGWRVDRYPDTACMPACLPSLPDCLAHICIRVERSRAEEHSRRSL